MPIMLGDPDFAFVGMAAVVGALLVFAGLLQFGVLVVRWLKLPQDPPEGAWFSPPAPPIADRLTVEEARARAVVQAGIRHLAHQAHLAQRAAARCAECVALAPDRRAVLEPIFERARKAAETADAAWRGETRDAAAVRSALRIALDARREGAAAIADVPESPRLKYMLYVLGGVLVLWSLSMLYMFRPR
jgi:hypothetical protein